MKRRAFLGALSAFPAATASFASAAPFLPLSISHAGIGAWEPHSSAPTPRRFVAVAAVRDRIYVIGGKSALGGALNEVYDPKIDLWLERAPMPLELHNLAAAALDGNMYAVGGFSGDDPVSDAYEYNPLSDQWRSIAPLPAPRGALAVAVLDGKIYAVGGRGPEGPVGTFERYDPKLNAWETLAALPHPREALVAEALDNRIHVIGGAKDASSKPTDAHDVYDVSEDRWGTGSHSRRRARLAPRAF
jgi:N-acetylneuraminic acid mutarotase